MGEKGVTSERRIIQACIDYLPKMGICARLFDRAIAFIRPVADSANGRSEPVSIKYAKACSCHRADAKYILRNSEIVVAGEVVLPRFRARPKIALICAAVLAAGVGGCKNSAQVLQDNNEGGWFSKKVDLFAKPEWAVTSDDKTASLGPSGPVGANELVGSDGRCATAEQPPALSAETQRSPNDRKAGAMAGDLANVRATALAANTGAGLPVVDPGTPQIAGGIALGMTECDTVRRAGPPGNVSISAGEKGERKVILTYLTGTWPGIYHFSDGRLKEIDRAPAPPEPVKKQKPKKTVKPKTATN